MSPLSATPLPETQKTDDELAAILDESIEWHMLTGNPVFFARYKSLRIGVEDTYKISQNKRSPGPLKRIDGAIHVELPQIYRLWKRLGLIKD